MKEETVKSPGTDETVTKEAPQLVALLKEMEEGLEIVRSKVQALTTKVKENQLPTTDGISFLESKHLLLLSYCQLLVYYLLRKAKGFLIGGHPVVRSLVETRLFLEKSRPVEDKLQYQIQKLLRVAGSAMDKASPSENVVEAKEKSEDLLKYRPNPDMLVNKSSEISKSQEGVDVYRPPKFAPTAMDEDKMSRKERNALRKEKQTLRQARQSAYIRELMDEFEGRPEEIRDFVGSESREFTKYTEKMEERAHQEEELFTRAPLTRMEKKKEKHLKKSRNGLLGITDSFYDEIRTLPLEEDAGELKAGFPNGGSSGPRHHKKRRCEGHVGSFSAYGRVERGARPKDHTLSGT
ncbi:Sas10/Utp3/C1D [Dillenia turbinata]|uniref:Sas10/Utp3/C1D n=1 Tax=Dillenia turbinata TaxID=194707 RepID=A0AAN8YR74_9MAGN